MTKPGILITLDGPDGVGKTTQFELLANRLRADGHVVHSAHMLGGTPIGEALRAVMFSDLARPAISNLHMSLAIYYALAKDLETKRQSGAIVLIDRSPLSLIAYQVYGDGLNEALGYQACDESLKALHPDKLLVYSAPVNVLLGRRTVRDKETDYFELQKTEYHQRTTEGYVAAAARYDATVIDANDTVEAVHAATMLAIKSIL